MNHQRRLVSRLANGRPTTKLLRRTDHGTRACYVSGCRCDPCTDAEAAYSATRVRTKR